MSWARNPQHVRYMASVVLQTRNNQISLRSNLLYQCFFGCASVFFGYAHHVQVFFWVRPPCTSVLWGAHTVGKCFWGARTVRKYLLGCAHGAQVFFGVCARGASFFWVCARGTSFFWCAHGAQVFFGVRAPCLIFLGGARTVRKRYLGCVYLGCTHRAQIFLGCTSVLCFSGCTHHSRGFFLGVRAPCAIVFWGAQVLFGCAHGVQVSFEVHGAQVFFGVRTPCASVSWG